MSPPLTELIGGLEPLLKMRPRETAIISIMAGVGGLMMRSPTMTQQWAATLGFVRLSFTSVRLILEEIQLDVRRLGLECVRSLRKSL
ncbi:MAG: hypothetical protein B7Y80_21155 [Hyphomicrobium sp. 32-62-53]|nr:MAG: hypothetical protein B7Z29_21020 [Hyphomicrobium sp. 12-62-95]OYX97032.1 MAG: hypothetical protein B7Y80_21155 [Hyphomicrobium sp. 32-62-53]